MVLQWNELEDKFPTESGTYLVSFSYRDRGEKKYSNIFSHYDNVLKSFEIELDYIPGCIVEKWRKICS